MPDTWTTNPPMLRQALEGMGARCGVEARVLKPRDPRWTCHLDSAAWQGDIYIHNVTDLRRDLWPAAVPAILALMAGLLMGLWWGRRERQNRAGPS